MKIITSTDALSICCKALAAHDYVTVDTEFLRETTFWPVLCLIQMAGPEDEVIVDPLAPGIDLQPFFDLMADSTVTKVFHAARQDIEIVFNRGGLIPHPMFDTQVAAMVCGFGDSVSYDTLVQKTLGISIDKTSRFTDWSRRPLSEKQLEYALADVTHLREIYLKLKGELEREGRTLWLSEEMGILEARETYDLAPENAWTRLKMRIKKPQELAVLKEVAAWREREARARNVPRGRILKDDTIHEIAQQQPRDSDAMARLRTVPKGWERSSSGQAVIDCVNTALDIPKADLPRVPRPANLPEGTAAAVELLRVLLKIVSEKHGVAAKIIASGDDLDQIAAFGEKADIAALHGWRRDLFGDPALKLINGRLAIRFIDRKVELVELESDAQPVSE
jgi:ribonuclease D